MSVMATEKFEAQSEPLGHDDAESHDGFRPTNSRVMLCPIPQNIPVHAAAPDAALLG